MRKKTRYLLLFLGFVVFAIMAPAIVLYVRGITFDPSTRTFVATGILAVRSDPKDADVFLNNKLARQGSGDIKFLVPGDYQVNLKKPGYSEWNKRLAILPGQVTWASPAFNNVYLFYTEPKIQTLETGVLDFYSNNSQVAYLKTNGVFIAPLDKLTEPKNYPFPKPSSTPAQTYNLNKILVADDAGKNFVLGQTENSKIQSTIFTFNSDSGQFFNISSLFNAVPKMQFGSNGELYALDAGILYKVDAQKLTKTPLFKKVSAFFMLSGSLYIIQTDNQSSWLSVSQSPFKDNQILLNGLPVFAQADMLVTPEKQIFIFSGGSLYVATSGMQKLADNINNWSQSLQNSTLAVVHAGELDYYDFPSGKLSFVTRSSEAIANPVINYNISGAFFSKNNSLMEIEMDTRSNQNQYILFTGKNLQKFSVDSNGKNVLVLDDGVLENLSIR